MFTILTFQYNIMSPKEIFIVVAQGAAIGSAVLRARGGLLGGKAAVSQACACRCGNLLLRKGSGLLGFKKETFFSRSVCVRV